MQPPGNNGVYRTSRRISRREDTLYDSACVSVGKIIAAAVVTTATAVAEMVEKQLAKESEEVRKAVVSHIVKALDGACVFYKDMSRKSK